MLRTSKVFCVKKNEIMNLMKKCATSIDYIDDDQKSPKKRMGSIVSDKSKTLTNQNDLRRSKEHVDNSRNTSEFRAKKFHDNIQRRIEQEADESEKWERALDDLILIQQE